MSWYVVCTNCGRDDLPTDQLLAACPSCGGEWLDPRYDYDRLAPVMREETGARSCTMWRFREWLPVHKDEHIVTMGEGGTPLLRLKNLSLMLGIPHLYLKDERQGPTASFKDRQASLAISVLREHGIREVVVASTGNVAISYSAYAAQAGIKLWTFLTSSVPADKMREVALYGSEVVKVTATYDRTKQVAARFAEQRGLFLDRGIKGMAARESMKTIAYEIAQQLGWRSPDWYIQAVSGGLGPVGVLKGFWELREMGLVETMPKIACIQAAGCAPMVRAWEQGLPQTCCGRIPSDFDHHSSHWRPRHCL
ncbi:MAG: pyridoxal-phosphate dependent enzyme [Ardenticatenia bacterium]|nr:pyridoxal-phosphate dependent enzyme [Ardenticatenia bacterium]